MKRIYIIILTMLFCGFLCKAQNFNSLDEKVVIETRIELSPKGKDAPVVPNTRLFEFHFSKQIQKVRDRAPIFFRIFEPLTSAERAIMRRIWVDIYLDKNLKMNYFVISIKKEDRDFFIEKEQKMIEWICETYSDLSNGDNDFDILEPQTFNGGKITVTPRGFYVQASDLLTK